MSDTQDPTSEITRDSGGHASDGFRSTAHSAIPNTAAHSTDTERKLGWINTCDLIALGDEHVLDCCEIPSNSRNTATLSTLHATNTFLSRTEHSTAVDTCSVRAPHASQHKRRATVAASDIDSTYIWRLLHRLIDDRLPQPNPSLMQPCHYEPPLRTLNRRTRFGVHPRCLVLSLAFYTIKIG